VIWPVERSVSAHRSPYGDASTRARGASSDEPGFASCRVAPGGTLEVCRRADRAWSCVPADSGSSGRLRQDRDHLGGLGGSQDEFEAAQAEVVRGGEPSGGRASQVRVDGETLHFGESVAEVPCLLRGWPMLRSSVRRPCGDKGEGRRLVQGASKGQIPPLWRAISIRSKSSRSRSTAFVRSVEAVSRCL
jgi:hypothetical protein